MANVICMSFSSIKQAEKAKKALRLKDETPPTILEETTKWGLVSYDVAASQEAIMVFIENLHPGAKATFFVGVDEEECFELLANRAAANEWIKSR